jgi:hypothetical protein
MSTATKTPATKVAANQVELAFEPRAISKGENKRTEQEALAMRRYCIVDALPQSVDGDLGKILLNVLETKRQEIFAEWCMTFPSATEFDDNLVNEQAVVAAMLAASVSQRLTKEGVSKWFPSSSFALALTEKWILAGASNEQLEQKLAKVLEQLQRFTSPVLNFTPAELAGLPVMLSPYSDDPMIKSFLSRISKAVEAKKEDSLLSIMGD